MSAYRDHVQPTRIDFREPFTQASHECVDGLFANAVALGFSPHGINDLVSAAYLTRRIVQLFEEPILGR